MDTIHITEISILPIKPRNGLIAFANCVVNNSIFIGSIAIYTSVSNPGDYRLVYPSKRLTNGKEINVFHPIHREAGELFSKAIIGKFKELMFTEEE